METETPLYVDEEFLRELALLNPDNKKLLYQIRRVYKEIMHLRLELNKALMTSVSV